MKDIITEISIVTSETKMWIGEVNSEKHLPKTIMVDVKCSDGNTTINVVEIRAGEQDDEVTENTPLITKVYQGTPWYISIFIIVNSILGAGMLNFPSAFHESGGIVSSVVCQLVVTVILVFSLIGFVRCAQLFNSASYQDVIGSFLGRKMSFLCSVLVLLYTFGSSAAFLIIIGDQIQMFVQAACPHLVLDAPWYVDRKFLLSVVSILTVLPLCYSKRIDFLKYPSSVGIVAVIYCVLLVVVKYFTGVDGADVGPTRTSPENIADIFLVVPTICFSYQCHLNIVPIFACTKNRESKCFDKAIILSVVICFVIYNTFAIFGYLTFGSFVQPDILLNYKPTPEVLAGVVGIAVKMIVSYPLLQFVGRKVVEDLLMKLKSNSKQPEDVDRHEKARRITVATIWFGLALAISLYVPDIDKVIVYLGGLAAIFIFVFPGLCMFEYMFAVQGSTKCEKWSVTAAAVVCISIGGFILGVTTTANIMRNIS